MLYSLIINFNFNLFVSSIFTYQLNYYDESYFSKRFVKFRIELGLIRNPKFN